MGAESTGAARTAMANVYGPTEATVQATGGFQPAGRLMHTGWPVDNVTLHVIDESGKGAGRDRGRDLSRRAGGRPWLSG